MTENGAVNILISVSDKTVYYVIKQYAINKNNYI